MCGILGLWSPRSSRAAIEFCLRRLAHRGPDDQGQYVDPQWGVALGHVRLSILDLSAAGHQPMIGAGGHVVLVFNGEIYNFRELRSELESRGASFCGNSDTEVLLELYLHEGLAMLTRLNGISAFAIWDKRSQELLLARGSLRCCRASVRINRNRRRRAQLLGFHESSK